MILYLVQYRKENKNEEKKEKKIKMKKIKEKKNKKKFYQIDILAIFRDFGVRPKSKNR